MKTYCSALFTYLNQILAERRAIGVKTGGRFDSPQQLRQAKALLQAFFASSAAGSGRLASELRPPGLRR